MSNPIGLFQIIARAGSFNHIASNQSLKSEYAKLQAGISTLEAIPTLESSLSLSKQDRTVGGSSAQLVSGVAQPNNNEGYSASSVRREQSGQLIINLLIAQLGVAGLNSTVSSPEILIAAQEERSS